MLVVSPLVFLSTSPSSYYSTPPSSSSSKIIIKIVQSNDGQLYYLFSFYCYFLHSSKDDCMYGCIYTLLEALAVFNCIVYCAFIRSLTRITKPLEMQVKMMMTTYDGRQTVAHTSTHTLLMIVSN